MAYPWTFGGTTINITAPTLGERTEAVFSERIIPGSSPVETYLDYAGTALSVLTLELHFPDPANYVSMKGMVDGAKHSLNYVGGTVTATMISLERTKRNLGSEGETWATAQFKVTG